MLEIIPGPFFLLLSTFLHRIFSWFLDLFQLFVFWFCTTSKVSVTFPLSSPLLSSSFCLSHCSLLDSPCVRLFYGVKRSAQWDMVCVQIICLLGHFSWLPLWRPLNVENTKVWGRGRAFVCSHPPSSLWHLVGPVAAQGRRRREAKPRSFPVSIQKPTQSYSNLVQKIKPITLKLSKVFAVQKDF